MDELINKIRVMFEKEEDEGEGFINLGNFRISDECMFLIVIFIILFVYKKEVMKMVNKLLSKFE